MAHKQIECENAFQSAGRLEIKLKTKLAKMQVLTYYFKQCFISSFLIDAKLIFRRKLTWVTDSLRDGKTKSRKNHQ
jgi:hypothetical protein